MGSEFKIMNCAFNVNLLLYTLQKLCLSPSIKIREESSLFSSHSELHWFIKSNDWSVPSQVSYHPVLCVSLLSTSPSVWPLTTADLLSPSSFSQPDDAGLRHSVWVRLHHQNSTPCSFPCLKKWTLGDKSLFCSHSELHWFIKSNDWSVLSQVSCHPVLCVSLLSTSYCLYISSLVVITVPFPGSRVGLWYCEIMVNCEIMLNCGIVKL